MTGVRGVFLIEIIKLNVNVDRLELKSVLAHL